MCFIHQSQHLDPVKALYNLEIEVIATLNHLFIEITTLFNLITQI